MTTLTTPQATTALDLASSWQRLPEDERKRRAALAANQHDAATLSDMTVAHLKLHSRASAYTVRNYRAAVSRLAASWQADGVNMLRPARDAGHLYIRQLEATLAAGTVRVHLAACAALYRALRWTAATEAHPFADVRVVKADKRRNDEKREAFEEDELAAMMSLANEVDAVLVLLGSRGGLRIAEALSLTWDAVHLDKRTPILTVNGKGNRTREVPIVPELAEALHTLRSTSTEQEPHVLPYRSSTRARQRLARLQERAGIVRQRGRSIHSLRHSAGTAVYAATGDLVAVQFWLGHASINTSRGYVHRAQRSSLATVAEALPRIGRGED